MKLSRQEFLRMLSLYIYVFETSNGAGLKWQNAGQRQMLSIHSFGAKLVCGPGSENKNKVSELRFDSGDQLSMDNFGVLTIRSQFAQIRCTPLPLWNERQKLPKDDKTCQCGQPAAYNTITEKYCGACENCMPF